MAGRDSRPAQKRPRNRSSPTCRFSTSGCPFATLYAKPSAAPKRSQRYRALPTDEAVPPLTRYLVPAGQALARAHTIARQVTDGAPLLCSADILLPIVDIGQKRRWLPRDAGEHPPDAALAFPRLPQQVAPALHWLFGGWLPKTYYYFEIAMGWALVSIVIAGFSGLLGHAREE
jgi:hypothetical protein